MISSMERYVTIKNIKKKSKLFGQQNLINVLENVLKNKETICVYGNTGSGKTHIVEHVLQGTKFLKLSHTWNNENGRCEYCGVNENMYERDEGYESYAFSFIHKNDPNEFFNMKFDVIIGNPPYQMSDGGGTGDSAKPVYNLFVEQAKKT